jgi:chromosome partitioning protein
MQTFKFLLTPSAIFNKFGYQKPQLKDAEMIVTIANQKGGTGKTTLAYNLATMRSRRLNVLAIDADPQESLFDLFQIRTLDPKPTCICVQGSKIAAGLDKARQTFDDVILDMPGKDDDVLLQVLLRSDVFLIPFRPSILDLKAIENMNALAGAVKDRNPNLKTLAVMNMAPTHHLEKETKTAKFQLKKLENLRLLDVIIRDRAVFRQSVDQGLTVIETTNHPAIKEIETLYGRIF